MSSQGPSFGASPAGSNQLTDWTRSVDAFGRRVWRKPTPEERVAGRRAGYVAAIVINAIMIYIVEHLLAWNVPFLLPSFAGVVWAIDLSLWATIVANVFYLMYDARWFRDAVQIVLNAIAFVVSSILYATFPFDFGATGNDLGRLFILFIMGCLVLATIVQVVMLVVDLVRDAAQV